VVAWAVSKGSDARDARDAAHEGWHGLSLQVPHWDREEIHAAIMRLSPSDRVLQEVQARAAEWLVCEALGLDYDVEGWALIAAMEAAQANVSMPFEAWVTGIRNARKDTSVLDFVASLVTRAAS
jgi:hypothetical protein